MAVLAISDAASLFLLHHNVFAWLSRADFLDSRHANNIERLGLLLSFCWLLLLGKTAVDYRNGIPKIEIGPVHTAVVIAFGLGMLVIKWNHFVAPISFFPQKTAVFFGYSVFDPEATAPVMAMVLGVITVAVGGALMLVVRVMKIALVKNNQGSDG